MAQRIPQFCAPADSCDFSVSALASFVGGTFRETHCWAAHSMLQAEHPMHENALKTLSPEGIFRKRQLLQHP